MNEENVNKPGHIHVYPPNEIKNEAAIDLLKQRIGFTNHQIKVQRTRIEAIRDLGRDAESDLWVLERSRQAILKSFAVFLNESGGYHMDKKMWHDMGEHCEDERCQECCEHYDRNQLTVDCNICGKPLE